MALNQGSGADQARAFGARQANVPFTHPNRNTTNNSSKFANAGAAAGGFVGAMGSSFVPPVTVNINRGTQNNGGGQQGGGGSHFILGDPDFNSVDDVRNYCNTVRALMIHAAIELAMASKILEARLAQAQTLPGDNPIQARMRALKVGRKLKKAADGATAAAKSAVGAYAAFTREYADLMRPRPQRAATTNPFKF